MMSRHCSKWARAALAAACAPAFAVAQQAADADLPSLPPVTVTATPNPLERDLLPSTTESVTSMEMAEKINVMNVEDALRYMPSLIVRKRHFGDTQDPVATRTSGLGQSARSLVYGDGVLLSALIGNNNTFATPRWGMVTPEEISRIDVLYGPFAAAYPGNSMGAVIEMTTRRPREFEAGIDVSGAWQTFKLYGTNDNYGTYQVNAYVAGQSNGLGWWLSGNHLDSHSQPLGIATVTRPTNPSAAGTPIAGAYADQNRLGAPIAVLGATGFEHQVQDNAKVKLTYDFTSDVQAFRAALAEVVADGGGDYPEALDEAFAEAVAAPSWRDPATTLQLMFLVADAPPHVERQVSGYDESVRSAVSRGIKVFPVASSESDDQAEAVFRQVAQATGARFVFLSYGAGGAATGPSTDIDSTDYEELALEDLVVRLVAEEVAALTGNAAVVPPPSSTTTTVPPEQ